LIWQRFQAYHAVPKNVKRDFAFSKKEKEKKQKKKKNALTPQRSRAFAKLRFSSRQFLKDCYLLKTFILSPRAAAREDYKKFMKFQFFRKAFWGGSRCYLKEKEARELWHFLTGYQIITAAQMQVCKKLFGAEFQEVLPPTEED